MLTTGAVLSAESCVGPMPTRLLMTCTGPGSEASRSVRFSGEPGGRMPVLRKPHSWSVQPATTEGNAGGLDAEVGSLSAMKGSTVLPAPPLAAPPALELVIVPTGKLEPGIDPPGKLMNRALAPAKPPTALLAPALAEPTNPPSMLLPPPLTPPAAELSAMTPSLLPASPPAILPAPTLTLPVAWPSMISAVLTKAEPSPLGQPLQLKLLKIELEATSPPATLAPPACTSPVAIDDRMVPLLSPTSPPALRLEPAGFPTGPPANESVISP